MKTNAWSFVLSIHSTEMPSATIPLLIHCICSWPRSKQQAQNINIVHEMFTTEYKVKSYTVNGPPIDQHTKWTHESHLPAVFLELRDCTVVQVKPDFFGKGSYLLQLEVNDAQSACEVTRLTQQALKTWFGVTSEQYVPEQPLRINVTVQSNVLNERVCKESAARIVSGVEPLSVGSRLQEGMWVYLSPAGGHTVTGPNAGGMYADGTHAGVMWQCFMILEP